MQKCTPSYPPYGKRLLRDNHWFKMLKRPNVDLVTEPNPKDDHIERDGAHVYVAPEAALFLFGTEMDFEQTTLRTGFTFRNPNQSSAPPG